MEFTTIITGLAFPEGIRWHEGALYFSDMQSQQVMRWSDGVLSVLAHVPGKPSGLGFSGADTILIASQDDRLLKRGVTTRFNQKLETVADLSDVATWHLNDMLCTPEGQCYVGNYGNAAPPGDPIAPATLALVQPDGAVSAAAEELYFPNGMAFLNEGAQLVVAETRSEPGRLTIFDRHKDGTLSNRRVLYEFDGQWPDGIAVDGHENIWVASPFSHEVLCISAGGELLKSVEVQNPYAVAVGGPAGDQLFVATAETWMPEEAAVQRTGAIVQVSGAI